MKGSIDTILPQYSHHVKSYYHNNQHRHERLLHKGKKKGKGKKKTSAPTTSAKPSSTPSASPSNAPTISVKPSSSPSVSPTAIPTSTPTSSPSQSPSHAPSDIPSSSPSDSPSDVPSKTPSALPTNKPSPSPSLAPSLSSAPSSSPSLSHAPSINKMNIDEPIYDSNGIQIGIGSGCPTPKELDPTRYKQEDLKSITIEYQYSMQVDEDYDFTDDMLANIDSDVQHFMFENYVNCQGTDVDDNDNSSGGLRRHRHRHRRAQLLANGEFYDKNQIIGVSTLPADKFNNQEDVTCTDQIAGKKCIIVDAGVTVYLEQNANVNTELEKYQVLLFLSSNMDTIILNSIDDESSFPTGPFFVGNQDFNIGSGEALVSGLNTGDDIEIEDTTEGVSAMGGLVIGSSAFLVIGAFAALRQKRKNRYSGVNNESVLDELDKEYDGSRDRDPDSPFDLDERNTIESSEITPPRLKVRRMNNDERPGSSTSKLSFPVVLSETRNGKRFPISRSLTNQTIYEQVQDVHQCTSATCTMCRKGNAKSRIRFIDTREWYDDIEVDLDEDNDYDDRSGSDRISDRTEKTLDFSKPNALTTSRSYRSSNTVTL